MKALWFLFIAWGLLGFCAENSDVSKAYVAMAGAWIGIVFMKLKETGDE